MISLKHSSVELVEHTPPVFSRFVQKLKRPSKKQFFISLLILILLIVALAIGVKLNNNHIANSAAPFIYADIQAVPKKQAALVLGTSKHLSGGYINGYYRYRIDAAAALFKAGKVNAIIVSGDNRKKNYDEPTTMHDDLVAKGVPSQYITLDYAGFRTLDSIVRAEQIFDLNDYILVSQKFHLERAIYLAHANKQSVIGYMAKDVQSAYWTKKMEHRELLARAKAFLDIHILRTEPMFYGKKVKVIYKETFAQEI